MTVPAVAGDFLAAAGRHIAAAAGFHGELPSDVQRRAVYQISRMAATITRLLADLPDEFGPSPDPERQAGAPVVTARLALARAVHRLQPAAASASAAGADLHPAVAHLAAAADNLAACRDLLQTHFTTGPDGIRTGASYWAPVINESGPRHQAAPAASRGPDPTPHFRKWTAVRQPTCPRPADCCMCP